MKKKFEGKGYNKGDTYEDKIANILKEKKLLPKEYERAGASDKADVEIKTKNKVFKIEIKADQNADYGQKYLKWSKRDGWTWVKDDNITKMYSEMKIIGNYIKKDFIPKKFTKNKDKISNSDKKYDQSKFEKPDINIPLQVLFDYYAEKNIYYMQLEKSGFYHLRKDINNLGTLQFNGKISLRLRAKTINSTKKNYYTNKEGKKIRENTGIPTPWNYGFLAVIKMRTKPTSSKYDIEELDGREFPPFN